MHDVLLFLVVCVGPLFPKEVLKAPAGNRRRVVIILLPPLIWRTHLEVIEASLDLEWELVWMKARKSSQPDARCHG
jgi:hypothetical protein